MNLKRFARTNPKVQPKRASFAQFPQVRVMLGFAALRRSFTSTFVERGGAMGCCHLMCIPSCVFSELGGIAQSLAAPPGHFEQSKDKIRSREENGINMIYNKHGRTV